MSDDRSSPLRVNYAGLAATHAALAVVEAALTFPALKEAWSRMRPAEWHAVRQAVKAALLTEAPVSPAETIPGQLVVDVRMGQRHHHSVVDAGARPRMFDAVVAAATFPEFDNHHSALTCPYCNPKGLKVAEPASEPPAPEDEPREQVNVQPLPWRYEKDTFDPSATVYDANDIPIFSGVTPEEAAFIVRACNASAPGDDGATGAVVTNG